jgi:dihydrofolate reductase
VTKEGGTTFTFVTDGIERALEQAEEAAGDKDVSVAGGANVVQQCLKAGLLDEMQIHLVPVETTRVVDSPRVTHLRFRVAG